jgi:hypothetical protein
MAGVEDQAARAGLEEARQRVEELEGADPAEVEPAGTTSTDPFRLIPPLL